MITLEEGVEMVWNAFEDMYGGEIYVKKIPSMKVVDIAKTIAPDCVLKFTGIRPGEKLHEQMIGIEDAPYTYEYSDYFKILPQINNWDKDKQRIKNGKKVNDDFFYTSNTNNQWMTNRQLKKWVENNLNHSFNES
jgi:FlaA1/EpsC-like NDP-sugar epimerase